MFLGYWLCPHLFPRLRTVITCVSLCLSCIYSRFFVSSRLWIVFGLLILCLCPQQTLSLSQRQWQRSFLSWNLSPTKSLTRFVSRHQSLSRRESSWSTMAWNGMMYGSSGSASAHHPVGFTLAARSLGSNGDCRPYGSTGVPRPSDSALVSCSAYVMDIRAFACALALHPRRAPPSLRLCLDPQSHWLCLCPLAKFNSDMTKSGNIWVDELHWFRFRSFVPATLNMDLFYLKMPSKKSSQCPLHLQVDI